MEVSVDMLQGSGCDFELFRDFGSPMGRSSWPLLLHFSCQGVAATSDKIDISVDQFRCIGREDIQR